MSEESTTLRCGENRVAIVEVLSPGNHSNSPGTGSIARPGGIAADFVLPEELLRIVSDNQRILLFAAQAEAVAATAQAIGIAHLQFAQVVRNLAV